MTHGTSTSLPSPDRSGGVRGLVVVVTAIAAVLIWGVRALVALRSGTPVAESLAIGGRAALFGGAGFGATFGAVVYGERRREQRERAEEDEVHR